MKYDIIPAKEIQVGDVIFTNDPESDQQLCGRAIGETIPRPHPDLTEWRIEVVVSTGDTPAGTHTSISFRHNKRIAIAREDKYVDVDVAGLLADLDKE